MKLKKKAMFACALVCLGLVLALPATRDELAWSWANLQDAAPAYELYYTEWPNGLHVAQSRLRYKELTWDDTKRAMIADAIKKHRAAQSDREAQKERQERMEILWWKQVTNQNTLFGYNDYLQRYPKGQYVNQARQRISILTNPEGLDRSDQNGTER